MDSNFELDIDKLKKQLIIIENLSQLDEEIKNYHPDDPRYVPYWRDIKRKCIEGFWINEFGKKRFVPGRLYYYKNFCTILDVNEEENTRIKIQPEVRDIEWLRSYMVLQAEGFSGFDKDEEYSSDKYLEEPNTDELNLLQRINKRRYKSLLKPDGTYKDYIPVWENITKLHDKELGKAYYWNDAMNVNELGCLHESVKVRMFDGTTKFSKDIKVGDKLMGVDSTSRTVINLVRGKGIMYDITTRYGDKYRVTDSHLHRVRKYMHNRIEELNLDTNELLDIKEQTLQVQYEAIIQKIEYPEQEQLLHPYFIGYWLGDGFKREKLICYNEDDKDIIEKWLINYVNTNPNRFSYTIKEIDTSFSMGTKKMYRFRIIDNTMLSKNNYWTKTFKNNKHIPDNYLYSSIDQRMQLLAGFIDSDGNYDKTRFKIYNSDYKLIKQLQELSRSLGFKTTLNERVNSINNSINYYLQITGDIHLIPTKYSRKQAKKTIKQGSARNHIKIDITSGKVENFYGFEIDGDNLFLLEDYTVTHNARGGGKSYYYSLAVCGHELAFNGLKYYTEESMIKPPKAEICIGSGRTDKSSEFAKKIQDSNNELAINSKLGAFGKIGDDYYMPCPLYKEMKGTLKPNNKTNLWRHEYDVNSNGQWITKGSGSYISHVSYSTQKKEGGEAAAGGRYGKVIYEEEGLTELLEEAFQSNKATVSVEGKQFGCQIGLGTSGNMETILPAKKWFLNPKLFNTVEFDDVYENSGKIAFFLPAFLTARQFKDENGNTDLEAAINFYLKRRKSYLDNRDVKGLEGEMMNYPIRPSEMFLSSVGNILPIAEIMEHVRDLTLRNSFHDYATVGELLFDSSNQYGVKFKPDLENKLAPITTYPLPKGYSQEGALVIYEHPIEEQFTNEDGKIQYRIPKDLYLIGHDPVAKDHTTNEGSLSSIFVLKTALDPIKYGYYELVAEYVGRFQEGRDPINELMEKLAMYYGNNPGMIYFENQVGNVVEHFKKKGKLYLLASQTQNVFNNRGSVNKQITYGYPISNNIIKSQAIDYLADFLKEPRILGNNEQPKTDADGNIITYLNTKMNLHSIKSMRLLQEFLSYNDSGNFDGVMGFLGCIIGVREKFNQYKQRSNSANQNAITKTNNILSSFIKDDYILNKRRNNSNNILNKIRDRNER